MTIRSVGAELLHVDERSDMTKLIAAFRNFVKAPRKDADQGESLRRQNGYLKC